LSFVPKYGCTATYTAGWKEEPVHENSFTVIVRVIGQQTMPFVLLFTTTVSRTSLSLQLVPVKYILGVINDFIYRNNEVGVIFVLNMKTGINCVSKLNFFKPRVMDEVHEVSYSKCMQLNLVITS
jgi:hypothetical protein